eukprot:1433897-Amphidinium_carterae.1
METKRRERGSAPPKRIETIGAHATSQEYTYVHIYDIGVQSTAPYIPRLPLESSPQLFANEALHNSSPTANLPGTHMASTQTGMEKPLSLSM